MIRRSFFLLAGALLFGARAQSAVVDAVVPRLASPALAPSVAVGSGGLSVASGVPAFAAPAPTLLAAPAASARAAAPAAAAASAVAPYADLQAAGFAVVPHAEFMDETTRAAFNGAWRRNLEVKSRRDSTLTLYRVRKGEPDWVSRSRRIQDFVARETEKLKAALSGENFHLGAAMIQVTDNKVARASGPHVDTNNPYQFVLTYPLRRRDPATVIYRLDADGRGADRLRPAAGSAAVFSGIGGEISGRRPGTLHAAPTEKVRRRVVLILTFLTDGGPAWKDMPRRVVAATERRAARLARLLERRPGSVRDATP
jgi:hypothetical protein